MPDILTIVTQAIFEFLRQVSPDEDYVNKSNLPDYMTRDRHGLELEVFWRTYRYRDYPDNTEIFETYAETTFFRMPITEVI